MFRAIQYVFLIPGLLLVFGGEKFSLPFLTYIGIACLGGFSATVGWEAIITRHIIVGSRRHGTRRSYSGLAAIVQGIQFNLIGLFLFGAAFMLYFNQQSLGREIFLQFVRRPGLPLMGLGMLFLLQSLAVFSGYQQVNEGDGCAVTMNLLISRLLPGLILLVLGLGALGLGFLDMAVPALFDQWGGGLLEQLYEAR